MPEIYEDHEETELWADTLQAKYESEEPRTGTHVSDLTLCLRQSPLMRIYEPSWNIITLYRFTMGRALEKAFFSFIIPHTTEELEVEKDGIVGHIDFGDDPLDYECKATWSKEPKNPLALIDDKSYWFDQAGSYAMMRDRNECHLTVLYIVPVPKLVSYRLSWKRKELQELWDMMIERKRYTDELDASGRLPRRTHLTWLCSGCPVKSMCFSEKR